MIFVTVASHPFNRLVRTVDMWAALRKRKDVFAQIGPTSCHPTYVKWAKFLEPSKFQEVVKESTVIVAHAGVGSIITALEANKPIIVMPRRRHLREQRNDHQITTAKYFSKRNNVSVAFDKNELIECLDNIKKIKKNKRISSVPSAKLINTMKNFINE